MLALPLLQDQLLDVLIGKNTAVLKQKIISVCLEVVATIFLVFQRLFRRYLVINYLPLLSLFSLSGAHPLAHTASHKRSLRLPRAAHHIVFLAFASQFRGVLVLALVFSALVLCFRLKVVIVSWEIFCKWLCKHQGAIVFSFLRAIEQFHGEIIVFLVIHELLLVEHENFSIPAHVLSFMFVPPPGFLHRSYSPFFRRILPSLAGQHSFLNFLLPL